MPGSLRPNGQSSARPASRSTWPCSEHGVTASPKIRNRGRALGEASIILQQMESRFSAVPRRRRQARTESRRGRLAVEIVALRPAITANTAERHPGIRPTKQILGCIDPPCSIAVPATITGPQLDGHARHVRLPAENPISFASPSPTPEASAPGGAENERGVRHGAYRLRRARHKRPTRRRSHAALRGRVPLSRALAAVGEGHQANESGDRRKQLPPHRP